MTRVAIIGGGIGGLTAARALHRRGIEVAVYEAAPELREIGAGGARRSTARTCLTCSRVRCRATSSRWERDVSAWNRMARQHGVSNHLVSPLAAWRRDLSIAVRRRFGRDPDGRGTAWIPEYDASSPDVLAA